MPVCTGEDIYLAENFEPLLSARAIAVAHPDVLTIGGAAEMKKTPDEKERLKAAELLGKYYALFTDRTQVEGIAQVQIIDDIPEGGADGQAD